MLDMTQTVIPKSDQLNAEDLIGGPMTLEVTDVKVVSGDQPVHIHYKGGTGRPFKPCKTVRRILILAWGKDGEQYVGRSMVVYNDPTVKWASAEVGGIRISHLSHIKEKIRMMLTVTRGKKKPYTVEPLQLTLGPALSSADAKLWKAEIDQASTMAELSAVAAKIKSNNYAEGTEKSGVLQHYQSAVTAIRNQGAEPVDPKNAEFPPDDQEAQTSSEGDALPGL